MKPISLLFVMAFTLTGCLTSPLLNHAKADEVDGSQKVAGCAFTFAKSGLCASLEWVKESTEDEQGEFTLRFWNPSEGTEHGPYVAAPAQVAVKLWMASMGHGSSPVKVIAAGTGVLRDSGVLCDAGRVGDLGPAQERRQGRRAVQDRLSPLIAFDGDGA